MNLERVNGVNLDGEWFDILEGSLQPVYLPDDSDYAEWMSFRTHEGTIRFPTSKLRALRYPPND